MKLGTSRKVDRAFGVEKAKVLLLPREKKGVCFELIPKKKKKRDPCWIDP